MDGSSAIPVNNKKHPNAGTTQRVNAAQSSGAREISTGSAAKIRLRSAGEGWRGCQAFITCSVELFIIGFLQNSF